MGETPDQIRQDIERTRSELAHDTDRLLDRADPRGIVDRRTRRIRDRTRGMRDRVMGSLPFSGEADEGGRHTAGQAADMARPVQERTARRTQGELVAAGLIAFGAGLLAASVLSESRAARRVAQCGGRRSSRSAGRRRSRPPASRSGRWSPRRS